MQRKKRGGREGCSCKQDGDMVASERRSVVSGACSHVGEAETAGAKALRQEHACGVPVHTWEPCSCSSLTEGEGAGRPEG